MKSCAFERKERGQVKLLELGLALTTNSTKALLELVDTTFGVDELVLTREEWVRVRRNTAGDHKVFNTVDNFSLSRTSGGVSDETATGRDVDENNRIVLRMNVFLHGDKGVIAFPTQ